MNLHWRRSSQSQCHGTWDWLFFCLASRLCYKNMPRKLSNKLRGLVALVDFSLDRRPCLYCMIFLMYEIKITFSAVSLLIIYYMIYKTNQSFEFGCCQLQFLDDKFSISRIFTLENSISRILGEPFEMSHK